MIESTEAAAPARTWGEQPPRGRAGPIRGGDKNPPFLFRGRAWAVQCREKGDQSTPFLTRGRAVAVRNRFGGDKNPPFLFSGRAWAVECREKADQSTSKSSISIPRTRVGSLMSREGRSKHSKILHSYFADAPWQCNIELRLIKPSKTLHFYFADAP